MKYNIICHDKKNIEITEQQKAAISKLINTSTRGVEINGEYVAFSSIARIEKGAEEIKKFKALPEEKRQPLKGLEQLREKMKAFKL